MVRKADHNSPDWRFTGFYGAPRSEDRHHSWRCLRTLHAIQHQAWLCVGDFNETLYGTEHFSRSPRPESQMRAFREVLDDCAMQDLGYSGVPYTWDNRQAGSANVKARIDRGVANSEFLQHFELARVRHISAIESDHCFVFVETRVSVDRRGPRQFRYENVWQSHVDYDRIVADLWRKNHSGQGLASISATLQCMQVELGTWGAREFGCLAKTVKKLQKKLELLRAQTVGRGPSNEEKATVIKLREALRQEEVWMRQRSRVPWLREGDINTKYYQAQAAQRKRMNRLSHLQREDGSVCAMDEDDKAEVQSFYQELYTSQGYNPMDTLLQYVPERVSWTSRMWLTR
ncbi:uncharacterized protein [Aegilops tauschii subsp. strangulata]|uniref:uncharacterized protein n=1 Tax=Aegilops tauschii subsp. strangulata TaxID=200361 RepID=UPI003CC8C0C0